MQIQKVYYKPLEETPEAWQVVVETDKGCIQIVYSEVEFLNAHDLNGFYELDLSQLTTGDWSFKIDRLESVQGKNDPPLLSVLFTSTNKQLLVVGWETDLNQTPPTRQEVLFFDTPQYKEMSSYYKVDEVILPPQS